LFYLILFIIGLQLTNEALLIFIKKFRGIRRIFSYKFANHKIAQDNYREKDFTLRHLKNELEYTKNLLKNEQVMRKSYVKYFFDKNIYENRPNYSYSKQMLSTAVLSLIFVYFISSVLLRSGEILTKIFSNLTMILYGFALNQMSEESEKKIEYALKFRDFFLTINSLISNIFSRACLMTSFVYIVQIFLTVKNYHKHILNAYKNVFIDIPAPREFTNSKLVYGSMHYR
jgi:hypothetical protein